MKIEAVVVKSTLNMSF